jgi:hypothetical protein
MNEVTPLVSKDGQSVRRISKYTAALFLLIPLFNTETRRPCMFWTSLRRLHLIATLGQLNYSRASLCPNGEL